MRSVARCSPRARSWAAARLDWYPSLLGGADVDDQRAAGVFAGEVWWVDSFESGPCLAEDLIDRTPVAPRGVHWGCVSYMRTATTKPEIAVRTATA